MRLDLQPRRDAITMLPLLAGSLLFAACGDAGPGDMEPDPGPQPQAEGPPGYTRYETTPVTLQPGESKVLLQWVAAPADADYDIVDIDGGQDAGGHHALLYATRVKQPTGTVRDYRHADQETIRLLGGYSGEGTAITPPDGTVFRIRAGDALVIQSRYHNASAAQITAHTYVDAKIVPASADSRVLSTFANTTISLDLQPGKQTTVTATCTLKEELPVLLYTNYMHDKGTAVKTEVTTDGVTAMLKDDPAWSYEWAFDANWAEATLVNPVVLPANSTITTTCTYMNDGEQALGYPDEMCAFFALHTGSRDTVCLQGAWLQL